MHNITFPLVAKNWNGYTKECNDIDELWEHIICREEKERSMMSLIITAHLHPMAFIPNEIKRILYHYQLIHRHGINFVYNGFEDIPVGALSAFDIIQNEIDRRELNKLKALKTNKDKSQKGSHK